MNRILIQHAVAAVLLSFGVFTLVNYDIALVDWDSPSKFGWAFLSILIYRDTIKQYRE